MNGFLVNFQGCNFDEVNRNLKIGWEKQKHVNFVRFLAKNPETISLVFSMTRRLNLQHKRTKYISLRIIHEYISKIKEDCLKVGVKRDVCLPRLVLVIVNLSQKMNEKSYCSMSYLARIIHKQTHTEEISKEVSREIKALNSFEKDVLEIVNYRMNFITIMDFINTYMASFWNIDQISGNYSRKKIISIIEVYLDMLFQFPKDFLLSNVHVMACSLMYMSFKIFTDEKLKLTAILKWLEKLTGVKEDVIVNSANEKLTFVKKLAEKWGAKGKK